MGNKSSFMLQDEEIQLISEETGFTPAQVERLYSRFTTLDKDTNGSLSKEDFLKIPELAINPLCDRIVHMFFVDCDEDHERINFRQFMNVLATFRPSSKPIRVRTPSKQEEIHTLFQYKHSRHSSCDGFLNTHQHHTTNQHSIHYVASTTHLAGHSPVGLCGSSNHFSNQSSKHLPLVDPNEPPNSRKSKMLFMFKVYDLDNDNELSLSDIRAILQMMVGKYIKEDKLTHLAEKTLVRADKDCNGYIDFNEFCNVFLNTDIDEALRVRFPTCPKSSSVDAIVTSTT